MRPLRAVLILTGFLLLTLATIPVQAVNLWLFPMAARRLPHWYHRQVCRLLGIRRTVTGEIVRDRPVLIVANHTSWIDIPVLSTVAPLSFVAKKEVGTWPFISLLARLQRTVFVDRERRTETASKANEILNRLAANDTIMLFAEGTSSDGNRVLPFKSSLFAAVLPPPRFGLPPESAVVQMLAMVYTRLHGVPLGRADRPVIGWYGDMDMLSHAWELLKAGPLDAQIHISAPVSLDAFKDRKDLAQRSEAYIRAHVVGMLRSGTAPILPLPEKHSVAIDKHAS